MKRIVFLDYVRVFACFLVMLVHACENYYGAPGSTDMAGPQSFLADETDRLWVSLFDGFSRMSVPLFMIVSAYLLVPMKEDESAWQFYRRRALRILPPMGFFLVLYATLPLLWGQLDAATAQTDLSRLLLNFPTLAGHLWFMYPLIGIYLFTPVVSPWLRKVSAREERFFIGLFLLSTCIPYLNRWCGEGGASVSGTSTTCCGISPAIWATWCWRTTSGCIWPGAGAGGWPSVPPQWPQGPC